MKPGDRVQTRYGPGTITAIRQPGPSKLMLASVVLDGAAAPVIFAESVLKPLAEEQLQLEPEDFGPWVQSLRDQAEGGQAR